MDEKKLLHVIKIMVSLWLCAIAALKPNFVWALENTESVSALPSATNTEKMSSPPLIFVSLSMPEATLKSLYIDAQAHGAALVLRGLKNHSFKQTTEALKQLGITVQIDPLLFKKYQIKAVPTFVWVVGPQTHTLSGNVSLAYALSQFKEAS